MEIEVFADDESAVRAAARRIVSEAIAAVAARGRFVLAVSGGHSPWIMLRILANEQLPSERLHVLQVDERIAPIGHAERNLTHLQESLLGKAPTGPGADPCYARGIAGSRSGSRTVCIDAPRDRRFTPRCWTGSTWDLGQTATPHLWCRRTLCSKSPIGTSLQPAFSREGGE